MFTHTAKPFSLDGNIPARIKKEKYIRPKKEAPPEYRDAAPATDDEIWFRHTNWKAKRERVRNALSMSGTSPTAMYAFQNCGGECLVEWCEEDQKYRLRGNYCKCRHCEPCQRAKANRLAANLRKRLEAKPNGRYRFVTLTLKHSATPLIDQIKRLYASFRKLRGSKLWKSSQRGGAAILEVKWIAKTRRWHPHLHIISEGGFIKQAELSGAWLAITGDSQIVDIRQLTSEKDAAHYVAKYMTKGTNNDVWHDQEAAIEWIIATKGVRSCATYGEWRGFKLLENEKSSGEWKVIDTLDNLARRARRGELHAINLLLILEDSHQYNPHKTRRTKEPDKP